MGDFGWLTAFGQGSPWVLVIGVLILVWRRAERRADRWEQATLTALEAVKELSANVATSARTTERLADAVNGWGTTDGRHRREGSSAG